MTGSRTKAPRVAVWKFASCDGCQLTLLDCEDELLALAAEVDLAYFLEAGSARGPGPYDLSLVEGSITTPADARRIRHVRRVSRKLVTIGACATAGGVQALRDLAGVRAFASLVYPRPDHIRALERSAPVSAYVPVDFELRGCPIDKGQLLEVVGAFLAGRRPVVPRHSVCVECKARGNPCVLVARGVACLGPVTRAGCGALCPAFGRGCFGCFGPSESPNAAALNARLRAGGLDDDELARLYRTFNAGVTGGCGDA
ncbi:oxidoreductase [Actinomadura sp. ATCC 31491]|uniref:Oxidoreductase n=1 Tax=Actinomadura luzonensis TaxID=2805427 RepID=A0ABT0FVI3_9ACTN|nr:oxidoreductase [Actinomadura luzonensis]MCK2215923.1 oxidoreductase [Actinomadura luzonensis]